MLNALLLMMLFGGVSWLGITVFNWDEAARARRGDTSGHRGKMLWRSKIGIGLVFSIGATLFIAMVLNDRSTPTSTGGDSDGWECSGSMRC